MIRRLNYTGRIKLAREDVQVVLRQQNGHLSFDADLSLADYGLPPEALVFVEAYRQTIWMRFAFGTVGAVLPPADRRLNEFDSPDDLLFRVKVTKAADEHILLAEADRVPLRRPEDQEGKRMPLLPVKPEKLGEEIWRLDFSDDRPRLLINSAAGDWRSIGRSPAFHALVYPAAFRQILTHVLIQEKHEDSDDPADWRSLWVRFATLLPGVGPLPSADDADARGDWIDAAVQSFGKKCQVMGKFSEFWKGDSAQ